MQGNRKQVSAPPLSIRLKHLKVKTDRRGHLLPHQIIRMMCKKLGPSSLLLCSRRANMLSGESEATTGGNTNCPTNTPICGGAITLPKARKNRICASTAQFILGLYRCAPKRYPAASWVLSTNFPFICPVSSHPPSHHNLYISIYHNIVVRFCKSVTSRLLASFARYAHKGGQ